MILLGICVNVDSANDTISNVNESSLKNLSDNKNITFIDEAYVLPSDSGIAKTDGKIYTDNSVKVKKQPTVSMTGRPSCTTCARNHKPYRWKTHTYVDYCPNCHHYRCLIDKHKRGAVHEKELTCKICDSDWCVECGKEKYSWSHKHLTKAE